MFYIRSWLIKFAIENVFSLQDLMDAFEFAEDISQSLNGEEDIFPSKINLLMTAALEPAAVYRQVYTCITTQLSVKI